jgi:hypothetical protein
MRVFAAKETFFVSNSILNLFPLRNFFFLKVIGYHDKD